jgi:hypothetical protein
MFIVKMKIKDSSKYFLPILDELEDVGGPCDHHKFILIKKAAGFNLLVPILIVEVQIYFHESVQHHQFHQHHLYTD